MWFEKLMGFTENSPADVQSKIEVSGNQLISKVNGKSYTYGSLEFPSLRELRTSISVPDSSTDTIVVSELVGNIQTIHQNSANQGAFFQAASQFNLLEMVSPSVTPESGVGGYEFDLTQGPACAIAAGAGTIYRNYFVEVNGKTGQSAGNQIDCLSDIGDALGNSKFQLWNMENGYALANEEGLINITQQIKSKTDQEYDELLSLLRIGIQWDTQVTINDCNHLVTQAYCSALPVAYSQQSSDLWEEFARLVLNATYEATLYAALLNFHKTGNNKVFLTLVGGGAFGNKIDWIFDAMKRSLHKFRNTPLDVQIVSFGSSNSSVKMFADSF